MKPLFIPLKGEYFDAFAAGTKDTEYRKLGDRWNRDTCVIGRPVVLSRGYGKQNRMRGLVIGFDVHKSPWDLPDWVKVYGPCQSLRAACIRISLSRECLLGSKFGETYPSCAKYPDCICGGPPDQPTGDA